MIVYNVTVTIDTLIHEEWLEWMKNKHIPDVLSTGCFVSGRVFRVMGTDPAADGGVSFAVQYQANTMGDYQRYQRMYAPRLQQEHAARYKDRFVALRTLLEEQ